MQPACFDWCCAVLCCGKARDTNFSFDRCLLDEMTDELAKERGGVNANHRGRKSWSRNSQTLSDWDDSVSVIDSILASASNNPLSESQIEGLRRVHKFLMAGPRNKRESHVPRELLEEGDSPGANSTSDYLLTAFAGIQTTSVKTRVLKVVNAHRFLSRISTASSGRQVGRGSADAYLLPEWSKLQPSEQKELAEILSWESLLRWDFDIFRVDHLTRGQPLLFVGWAILASPYSQYAMKVSLASSADRDAHIPHAPDMPGYCFTDQFKIPQINLANFLREVERQYIPTNPYHNNTHAADVLQSLHTLLSGMDAKTLTDTEVELFAILLAAVVHDMGHPGKNNLFQTNTLSDEALTYNDASVLENMHASLAFKILHGSHKHVGADIFVGMSEEQARSVRKLVISAVLGTDMTLHFDTVDKIKGLYLSYMSGDDGKKRDGDGSSRDATPITFKGDDSWEVLHFALHVADINNPAKPLALAVAWTDRCLEEFFRQGDEEKRLGLPVTPLCDRLTTKRAESQIGFIKFVVAPAYELLGEIFPSVRQNILPILDANVEYWKREVAKESAMQERNRGSKENSGKNIY